MKGGKRKKNKAGMMNAEQFVQCQGQLETEMARLKAISGPKEPATLLADPMYKKCHDAADRIKQVLQLYAFNALLANDSIEVNDEQGKSFRKDLRAVLESVHVATPLQEATLQKARLILDKFPNEDKRSRKGDGLGAASKSKRAKAERGPIHEENF